MVLPDRVLDEIRFRVVLGFDHRAGVFDCVLGQCARDLGIDAPEFTLADVDASLVTALHEAVDAAFLARALEARGWPTPTDHERLRVAFDALEGQGIVALEGAGLTPKEGIPLAADKAVTRDELGGYAHGYCFFTFNDAMRAIDGEGLSLAYGSFEPDEDDVEPAAPAPCARCGGKGWVMAADPSHGAELCACKKVAVPAPVAAPRAATPTEKVGAAVVEAARAAGLAPEWTGQGKDYVRFPRFHWSRRLLPAGEDQVRDFVAGWEMEMRAGYGEPASFLETLEARAGDWFAQCADFGPALMARLRQHTERFLAEEQERELAWQGATVNDRITAAFADLARDGFVGGENAGLSIQDGWGYAGIAGKGGQCRVAFFHRQDIIDALEGEPLLIAFGDVGEHDDDAAADEAVGKRVVAALEAHGVPCRWSGAAADRIRVLPFDWRRRRWTTAPEHVLEPAGAAARPSLLGRLFGKPSSATTTEVETSGPLVAPEAGILVVAFRDEGGFDVRRARTMRAAWTAQGHAGAGQASHVGVPHAFLPTGRYAAMAPRLAIANLGPERRTWFERGRRSDAAPNAASSANRPG
jgi:hypothetical protein